MNSFETFFKSYIETALWCSCDINNEENDDTSLENQGYSIDDFDSESLRKLQKDCCSFYTDNFDKIKNDFERAGHDFFLTSNHHGTGFWDGDWDSVIGKELTEESHKYSEVNFWVSKGKIYCD